jgi:hypothetical protein
MPRKPVEPEFDLDMAEDRVMAALDKQTSELEVYSSTPHTGENQARILSTLEILTDIEHLRGMQNGN